MAGSFYGTKSEIWAGTMVEVINGQLNNKLKHTLLIKLFLLAKSLSVEMRKEW